MNIFRKHAVEAVAAIWLFIVAVQYLSRYFIGGLEEVDFTPVYIGMLCLVIGVSLYRAVRLHFDKRK